MDKSCFSVGCMVTIKDVKDNRNGPGQIRAHIGAPLRVISVGGNTIRVQSLSENPSRFNVFPWRLKILFSHFDIEI